MAILVLVLIFNNNLPFKNDFLKFKAKVEADDRGKRASTPPRSPFKQPRRVRSY